MMNTRNAILGTLLLCAAAGVIPGHAGAAGVRSQCPADIVDPATGATTDPDVLCKHLAAGDGFAVMGDGKVLYTFGFTDVTGIPDDEVMEAGMLAANWPAPTLSFPEGKKIYLSVTNVGMMMRPDLFDPHSVHWHGFPNATPVFDGEPMSSISVNMGSTLTYYYETPGPGTYMYHCHVEATEHMQMGMLGNLYVRAAQDNLPDGTLLGTFVHHPDPDGNGPLWGSRYAYNDGDGSTRYDVDYPLQLVAFDPRFHEEHINVQPLPFANMHDTYPMLNGRGYPDTVNPDPLPPPEENGGKIAQPVNAIISAVQGQRILLRVSCLSTVEYYTVGVLGIPMLVVGKDARLLRGASGNQFYTTTSVNLGGGQAVDVILDTAGVAPGTYVLYAKNLNHLSNDNEDYGGMMTEIVINPAP